MRRVFLSFLGTTDYKPVNYCSEKFGRIDNIRFVQEALVQWHCSTWNDHDRIMILTTDESCVKNWKNDGHKDQGGNALHREGLRGRLEKIPLQAKVGNKIVPSGRNEGEVWEIFDIILSLIKEGDELYIDITHAFRSLPLLAMVTLNYAKVLKSVTVRAIDYGALEALALRDCWDIMKMPLENRNIPVFDLLPFDQLLDWTVAIDRFLGAGDAKLVETAARRAVRPILKECRGQNVEVKELEKLAKNLAAFSEVMATCRGRRIVKVAAHLKESLGIVLHQHTIKPLSPIMERLNDSISQFSGDEIKDGIAAARWCAEHNLVQQGFTILEETSTSHIIVKTLDADINDKTIRSLVNSAVTINRKKIPTARWKGDAKKYPEKIKVICDWLASEKELTNNLQNLTKYRNDINHAGQDDKAMQADKFSKKLKEIVSFLEQHIGQ